MSGVLGHPEMVIKVWDIGDNKIHVRMHTKAQMLPEDAFQMIEKVAGYFDDDKARDEHMRAWLMAHMMGGPEVEPVYPEEKP